MLSSQIQISAYVTPETKKMVEDFVEIKGGKESALLESALLHHIQALEELPSEIIIPPRLVVSSKSGAEILDRLNNPNKPTKAMVELFS